MKKLMICIVASCLLMTSCPSNKVVSKTVVPEIVFPKFPVLQRTINADGSWTIPKESVDLLAEYYIEILETEKTYKEIKDLYEGD